MINRKGVIEILKRMKDDCKYANKRCWRCSSSGICPRDGYLPLPCEWTNKEIKELIK